MFQIIYVVCERLLDLVCDVAPRKRSAVTAAPNLLKCPQTISTEDTSSTDSFSIAELDEETENTEISTGFDASGDTGEANEWTGSGLSEPAISADFDDTQSFTESEQDSAIEIVADDTSDVTPDDLADDEIYQEAVATDFHQKSCKELEEELERLRINSPKLLRLHPEKEMTSLTLSTSKLHTRSR